MDGRTMYGLIHWRTKMKMFLLFLIVFHGTLVLGESENESVGVNYLSTVTEKVSLRVSENQPSGTFIGRIPVKPGFQYRFNDNPAYFVLNGTTGEITTRVVIDRENLAEDVMNLVVLSSHPTYPIEVKVTIADENDNSPEFPDRMFNIKWSENAAVGTQYILDTASDADKGVNGISTNYEIVSGNTDDKFTLAITASLSGDEVYLYLENLKLLDREVTDNYVLNISARDAGTPARSGHAIVNVTVIDFNDSPPTFDHSEYAVSISENAAAEASVMRVRATDADVGANAEVSYYITDDTEQFAVERDTGIVRTLHDKLRCKKNICVFTVQAKDHGVPYLTGRAYVTVNLIDENDHSPEITFRYIPATSDYATVNENAQDGTIVALISVVDKDEGDNGRCSVAIKEGNELGAFRLEDAFGWSLLKVNKQIDREENSVYNLTILAWDHGEPPRESSENIIIVVNDVNDHTPTFLKLEYVAVLSESVPKGSFVASVSATDADTGINAKLTYSIVSGDSHGWFAIIADSGLITTARRLDRESSAMMTLNVSVNDGGPSPHISYAKVTVQILDENDETPAFTESVYNVSVSESLPPGSAIAAATAIDNDDGPNGTVVYAFDSDVEMKYPGTFLLDSATGKISTRVLLDREKRDFYSLGVIARDDGRPPLSSSAAVHVTVTDINDNSPIFYPTHYFASVLENLPAGTIVTKVDAYDLDAGSNGRVHYEITGGADGKFQIDPDSGAIKTSASLDREVTPVFKLTLRARDAGGRESAELAIVEIKVSDVHDTPPAFSRRRGYGFSIVEDGERPDVGRFVGAVEATSTLSRATVSYAIASGDHRGMFRVDASSGAISTSKPIDREQESVYHLIVVASDGSVPAKTNVTVTVLDVNDNAPYFASQSVDVHVYENWPVGHEVYVVDARDDDEGGNSRITYELEDNPGGMFRMNAVTGAVFLNKPVASSAREIYHAKVRASDNGVPRLSSSLRVAVHVHDVNDHTPRFTRPAYATSVRESAPLNHRFITVDARDDDTGPDGVVSYAITGGNADGKFGVFPDGFLYVQSGLDRETRDRYELTVTATDHGLQPRSSTARVVVHVADDNDNAPAFGNATYALRIGENLPPDTLVGVVSATDADLGRNGEVSYAMATRQGDFAVDALTGEIRTLRDFDREVLVELTGDDFFTVEVSAYDNGVPRLRSHATVVVYVVDANDNAPAFDQDVYEISVSESAPVGAPLLRVSAADADAGANGDVVYDVAGGNEERAFAIDSGSGKVRLARLLDRETASRYELVVRAQDGGEDVHLSTTALVVVIVQDANDNAPTFFEQTYGARVSEAALVGKSVGRVDAVDDDEGDNAVVTYAIVAGNQYETFGIDGRTGEVFLAKRLDYEQLPTYTLNVSAADHGVPALTSSVAFVVDVEDFNDNAPVFSSGPAVRQILEGIPINSAVFTVSATDRDSGNNGRVEYSIVKQEPKGAHFRIDAQTGTIYTNGEIDHEQQAMFKLIVRASDMADAPADRLAATKLVTILVEDVNDNEPKFVSMDAAVVPSTAPSNHLVTKVAAEDADDDDFGEVFYEIVDGDRDVFQLDGSTGYLYTRSPLAVDVATYSLSVRASDRARPPQRRAASSRVTVIVADEDAAKPPAFTRRRFRRSIPENEAIGSSVLSVATEGETDDMEFFITNISANGVLQPRLFAIEEKTGLMKTADVLDAELGVQVFYIDIVAVDKKSLHSVGDAQVEIQLIDVNDSPPVFDQDEYAFFVSEDAHVDHTIGKVMANDPDTVDTVHYHFYKGQKSPFKIDPTTGVLRTTQALDRELAPVYELGVRASDGVHFTDVTVTVHIEDVNDNAPHFDRAAFSFEVPENSRKGAVVAKVTATDADEGANGNVSYELISDWGGDVFSFNSDTGEFTLIDTLDYEQDEHYIFSVQARDAGRPRLSSACTVYINVGDLNDNAPVFTRQSYSTDDVREDVATGSSIITVTATDADSGENAELTYSIVDGDPKRQFGIHANGTVYNAAALDRETDSYYNLVVRATDRASPPSARLSATASVTVILRDVNDMAPAFRTPDYASVREGAPLGTVVMVVEAEDADEGKNSYVEYSLASAPGGEFSLGPVDGVLRVTGKLDREATENYTLVVTATDKGQPPHSTVQRISVKILDDNDNSPVFARSEYRAVLPEDTSVGTILLQLNATDRDAGNNGAVRYYIVDGDDALDFALDPRSGILTVRNPLDHEGVPAYRLTVHAEDLGVEPRRDVAVVVVTVTDVNDSPPVFLHSPYVVYVLESIAETPAAVTTVTADDADSPPNAQLTYSLQESHGGLFQIDVVTGEIQVTRPLDRETREEYWLTVLATDSGVEQQLSGTGRVKVIVQDVNDHSPAFSSDRYLAHVSENQPAGTRVIEVHAEDADEGNNGLVRYQLSDGESQHFALDSATGQLVTTVELDRERQATYELTVVAMDSSGAYTALTSTATVTVVVDDENDHRPSFADDNLVVYIPHPSSPGQFVAGVMAEDPDSGPNGLLKYSMAGPDAGKFVLNPNTGVIKTAAALSEARTRTPYILDVSVSDDGLPSLGSSMKVQVFTRPAASFPRFNAATSRFTFSEDTTNAVVTKVTAVSPKSGAAGRLRYRIASGNHGNVFALDDGGLLRVTRGLDYETRREYQLWLEARDAASPPLCDHALVTVELTDANDNAPAFSQYVYEVSVAEGQRPPAFVVRVNASDADDGANGEILYRLSADGNVGNAFSIDAETGEVTAEVELDHEATPSYRLTVEATDRGTPLLTGTATIAVSVADRNDNPPRFTRLFNEAVAENSPRGTFIVRVTSSDADDGVNANASYRLTKNPGGRFAIDERGGELTVAGALDREEQEEYSLIVLAADAHWRIETPITVTLTDENDNAPAFERDAYAFRVPETATAFSYVGQVRASDRDRPGPNSDVRYSLAAASDAFAVDAESGDVLTRARFRYASGGDNRHVITVVAADSGVPRLSSSVAVTIDIEDANDHAPVFDAAAYASPVPDNSPVGASILEVHAEDNEDYGENAVISYSIASGNGSDYFKVDVTTGVVRVAKSLHDRTNEQLQLTVAATDRGDPPLSSDVTATLHVTSENRFSPVFEKASYEATVPEDRPVGAVIAAVSATDRDVGVNGRVTYSISAAGGDDDGQFAVDADTGAISVARVLDYDVAGGGQHVVNVTARDGGLVAREASVALVVRVADVNDSPPRWNASVFDAYVRENAPAGAVVARLRARDADSRAATTYAIAGGDDAALFRLDARSGELTAAATFDYEARAEYAVDVVASDADDAALFDAARVRVHVVGENEYRPRFVVRQYSFRVSEMAQRGAVVGVVVAADEDGGRDGVVHYSLVGRNRDRGFAVQRETGRVVVAGRLDRERASELSLTVLAKNPGAIGGDDDTDTCEVHVTVEDANDPPVFEPAAYVSRVAEDAAVGTVVARVSAFDRDLRSDYQQFSYSIVGGDDGGAFAIDARDGVVTTARRLDRETVSVYNLTVAAVDTGAPPQTGTASVVVTLDDVNDHAPEFADAPLRGSVAEGMPAYTSVMTLSASDRDSPQNGAPFVYSLADGPDTRYFTLEPRSGVLRTTRVLDRETRDRYSLVVTVMDSGAPRMTSTHALEVLVADVNDSPSSPRDLLVAVHALAGRAPRGRIADVSPADPDLVGEYACVLEAGDRDVFAIPRACELHVLRPLRADAVYTLNVSASDGAHARVHSTVRVRSAAFTNATLENSVTLRFDNVTADAFAARFYDAFVRALGGALDAGRTFEIIAMQDVGDGALELRLAVRRGDTRYVAAADVVRAILRGQQRIERESGVKVAEVGRDPCASSPCRNGGACASRVVVYDDVVAADAPSLVFVSPRTELTHACRCASGFAGVSCDARQDHVCPPDACRNGGSCVWRGGAAACACVDGYHGERCELDVDECLRGGACENGGVCENTYGSYHCTCREPYTGARCEATISPCASSPCRNAGACVTDDSAAGFYCRCAFGYHGARCEQASYGFRALSYAEFPPLDARGNKIAIEFSTLRRDALLLYNHDGRAGERSLFLALELQDGRPVLSYRLAEEVVRVHIDVDVSNARWYRLTAQRRAKFATLSVGVCNSEGCEDCHDDGCQASGSSVGRASSLNLRGQHMSVGGVSSVDGLADRPGQVRSTDFIGCIRSIYVNDIRLDLSKPLSSRFVTDTCPRNEDMCLKRPCGSEGICIDEWDSHSCQCSEGITKLNCTKATEAFSLSADGWVELSMSDTFKRSKQISQQVAAHSRQRREALPSEQTLLIKFRTRANDGMLFYAKSSSEYTILQLYHGRVRYVSAVHGAIVTELLVEAGDSSDGRWHTVTLAQRANSIALALDGDHVEKSFSVPVHDFLSTDVSIFAVGGYAEPIRHVGQIIPGFSGCLSTLNINGEIQPLTGSGHLFDAVTYGEVAAGCEGPPVCSSAPCADDHVCVDEWHRYSCVSAAGGVSSGALHVGVVVVIIFFSLLFVVLLVTFVVFRRRRHLRDKKAAAATYVNACGGGGGGGGGGDAAGSSPTDSGYVNSESDIVRGHVRRELAKRHADDAQVAPPDVVAPSEPPPPADDAYRRRYAPTASRDAAPTLPDPTRDDDGSVIIETCDTPVPPPVPPRLEPVEEEVEHYDFDNASSIAASDIDVAYHYRDYRDGRRPPLPRPGGRPPPPYRRPDHLYNIPDANETTTVDLNSSSNSNNSNSTGVSAPRRARPPPPGRRSRGKLVAASPGLTADDVDKLHKTRSSLSSAIDNASSSSTGTVTPPVSRKTPLPPAVAAGDVAESSSDESGNDSFTCSEFEYDGPAADNPADRLSRLMQERKAKDYDSHGSMSTIVASDDDSSPHRPPQPPPRANGGSVNPQGVMSWDNLLNWGPNFESLVGVFKDIASLDDGATGDEQPLQQQLSGPPVSEEYV